MEKRNGRPPSLLVFDPVCSGDSVRRGLERGTWQRILKRGAHTLLEEAYQVVYVAPGLMTKEERDRSKVVRAERALDFQMRWFQGDAQPTALG